MAYPTLRRIDMKRNPGLYENTIHGTSVFPFDFYHCSIPESFTTLPVHWHEEFEFTYVLEGTVTYQINLHPFSVSKGDFILIPPEMLHGIIGEEYSNLVTDSFVFRMDLLASLRSDVCSSYLEPITQQLVRFPVVIPADASYIAKLHEIYEALLKLVNEKPTGYELEIKSLLLHLFFILYQFVPYDRQPENQMEITAKIKTALQYIQDNYREPISISDIGDYCGFSEYHFMRFFKKHMNMTCIKYLNQYRLDMASHQLSCTSVPITQVALENGFNNLSYFNRVFKKQFGITPKEFRKLTRI